MLTRPTTARSFSTTFIQHSGEKTYLVIQNLIILHDNARSHTAAVVMDFLHCLLWEILEHPPCSPVMSPCDYDLFIKVKEPLRGTQYNTRDEFIHAIGRSVWNIDKVVCADGVQRLLNIWQRVINKEDNYIEDK